MLMFLLFALNGVARADVATWLGEAGLVEVDASAVPGWNNESSRTFQVSAEDASSCVRITIGEKEYGLPLSRQEGAYEYLGTDNGEWGGELVATGPEGWRSVLLEDNIRSLVPTDDGLLVFTGLSHMGLRRGAVYRIDLPDREPKVELVTLLPDAPAVFVPLESTANRWRLAIIGSSSLMVLSRLSGRDQLQIALIEQPWSIAYPNSGVSMDGNIILGMRGGIGVVQSPKFFAQVPPPRYFTFRPPSEPSDEAEAASDVEPTDFHVCSQESH